MVRCGTRTLARWSDAAYGDQTKEGSCRLGYVIGLLPPSQRGPCHLLQWPAKSTSKLVRSSLGGGVDAFSEMVGHVALSRDFHGLIVDVSPRMAGFEACESLFTHLKNRSIITETYLARHLSSIQRALERAEVGNVFRPPSPGNPANELAEVRSDLVLLLSLSTAGSLFLQTPRRFKGVATYDSPRT